MTDIQRAAIPHALAGRDVSSKFLLPNFYFYKFFLVHWNDEIRFKDKHMSYLFMGTT